PQEGEVSVTVPVASPPPVMLPGAMANWETAGGGTLRVRSANGEGLPAAVAVILTVRSADTDEVMTWKLLDVCPAGTLTDKGALATAESALDKFTAKPPEGAAALSVTVPVEGLPAVTEDGESWSPFSCGGGATVMLLV